MKSLCRLFFTFTLLVLASSAWAQDSDRDRGIQLYRDGKYAEAIESLEKSFASNNKDRYTVMFLGAALHRSGRTKEAIKMFRRVDDIKLTKQVSDDLKPEVIRKRPARYTEAARQNNTTGKVWVAIEYGADGVIGFVLPYETLPFGLTESSIGAAMGVQFKPAMKDGKPVTTIGVLEYSFMIY